MRSPELPAVHVGEREARVRRELDARSLGALIVTTPENIRWLTGFAGSSATVLIDGDRVELFTDSRYAERAPQELALASSSADVTVTTNDLAERVGVAVGEGAVGFEAEHVTWSVYREMADRWFADRELVETKRLITGLRARKDEAEIARIEAAARAVDAALGEVLPQLRPGVTERGFARMLEAEIRWREVDDIAFSTIVAAGPNAAIPHHRPSDRVIEATEWVIVDVGAMVDGYRSDMTRTFCIGALSDDQRRWYDTVIAAQQAGVEAMVAGVQTADVDAAARGVITDAGWGAAFAHGTGHGVGLDIHELPAVHARADDVYELGTVATVEPGVYLSGRGGVRIEDTCVVTASGARRLTSFPKAPEL